MTIPEVRARLIELAEAHGLPELKSLAAHLRRRRAVRVAAVESRPVTDEVAEKIRQTAAANPGWSYSLIGQLCGVNIGRVSEVLRGKRT